LSVPRTAWLAWLGGPFRERMHAAYPRQLSQDQVRALVDRLRGTVQQQGTVKDVLGAVEWSVGGIVVDQLHPDLLGMLGLLGSGVAVGAGVARGLWSVTARGFRRRLRAVQSEIHQFMRTGESEESLPSGDGSSEDHRFEPGGSDG
jgi:hypothetical protein